jgi:asparagine synthase (glutamine-hydrolysing)
MPGIFGCISRGGSRLPRELNEDMEKSMKHESLYQSKISYRGSSLLGVVDLETVFENDQLMEESDGNVCVVIGKVYDKRELGHTTADIFLSLYKSENPDSIRDSMRQLNGSFAFAIYDENKGKMIIGNDRYGSKNVFYTINSDRLTFSSEIKSILKDPLIHPKLNVDAVGEFFTFSYLLGNKTFFEGINLLPPASILLYDSDGDKVQTRPYWDFKFYQRRKPGESLDYYLKRFDELMERAVERRMRDKDKIGVFLSGGLDSRLIAGFAKKIADRTNKELISFTFGTKGGWQEKIAGQVADKLGIDNSFYEIPSDFIARYADEIVYRGDGHIRIRDAHFISLLRKVRLEVGTVLVGAFCDTVFGGHLHKEILRISNKDELIGYLLSKYTVKQIAEHVPKITSQKFRNDLERKVKKNFVETVKSIPFHSYSEIAHYWDLVQRGRRYILPLSTYINWCLDSRDPYLDNEVVEFAINLPLELKIEKKFIHKASKRLFPSLAEIPWEQTGVPPDTQGPSLLLSKLRRRAGSEMKRFIERISGGNILFQNLDYQGYSYWLRTGSRRYVERSLLEKADQSILNQEYVKKILYDHMSCWKDHNQLICDLLNMKLFVDKFWKKEKLDASTANYKGCY